MEQNKNNFSMRLLVLICAPKPANKAAKLFHQGAIPVQYKLNGEGTASSEIMDMLGLGSSDKSILISTLPKHFADIMLLKLRRELRLGRQNTGIAFTIPISGASGSILRMLHQLHEKSNSNMRKDDINLTDNKYSLIAAIINRGYSGEVMDVARAAGARGGTIINSRRIGTEEAASFWGLNVLDEKEYIDHTYTFEVSSPGLTRQLKKEKDYIRSKGKLVDVVRENDRERKDEITEAE